MLLPMPAPVLPDVPPSVASVLPVAKIVNISIWCWMY